MTSVIAEDPAFNKFVKKKKKKKKNLRKMGNGE